ncbi:MAG: GNAT family N-acetyltransferase [Clostridia bacterium]|nr:GNAT family N-acetyltransferase [Clostridia bacterium]
MEANKSNIIFTNITNKNIRDYKKLRKIFAKYKMQTLRNHGETPCGRKMFFNLFDSIIASLSEDKTKHFIVMQAGKELLGFALIATVDNAIVDIPFSYGSVHDFYISPKHRRKGYGSIFNEHIESIFKEKGTNTVLLYPDPVSGIDFWKAMGYKATGIHQGWGRFLVYRKHLTENEHTAEIDKSIQGLVTPTDSFGINPYNKTQIKEVFAVWKEYCRQANRKPHKNDVRKMAFHARKNRNVHFSALYYKGNVIGFTFKAENEISHILPEYEKQEFHL